VQSTNLLQKRLDVLTNAMSAADRTINIYFGVGTVPTYSFLIDMSRKDDNDYDRNAKTPSQFEQ
jgi:hypothetical protein